MKKFLRRAFVVLLALFVLIQLWPVDRSNPPVTQPLEAPAEVMAVLKRACYDCHSNETVWPWYAYIAPLSWLVAHDAAEGREHLNFSEWAGFNANKRLSKADEMMEEIGRGNMPMYQYVWLHPAAKLSQLDVGILQKWVDGLE